MTLLHKTSLTGLYIAFCTVTGFLLAPIPNIEMISLTIFFGGYLFGIWPGIIIGGTAEFLYSAFNPWGSGLAFPPLLIAQVTGMMITGAAGGIAGKFVPGRVPSSLRPFLFAIAGAFVTITFNISVTISSFQFSGFSLEQLRLTILAGMAFSLWHIISNSILFALLVPTFIRISRNLPTVKSITEN